MHWILAAALFTAALTTGAQVPASSATPAVAISTVAIRQGPVIAIDATGPLPLPRVGTLKDPDRLYLDFDGVSSRTLRVRGDDRLVTSVRAALNSVAPKVTRVVIDLSAPCRYSLETSQRANGHVEIALTSAASGVDPRASSAPPPAPQSPSHTPQPSAPAPERASPASQPSSPPARFSPRDAATRRYLALIEPALSRLDVLRDVLHDLDARRIPAVDRMATAQSQLTAFRGTLDGARPTRPVQEAHDLLKSVIGFASTALALSSNVSGDVSPNASSAAAGALLMLDRAEVELGNSLRKSL
jgi:hypothetical protein